MMKQKKQKRHFIFSRWTRASYASFNSMHRVVNIGVLSVSMSIVTLGGLSAAGVQADTVRRAGGDYDIGEVVVAGQREDALPNVVRVLATASREDIERAPSPGINELLRTLPGVDLRQRGPLGTQADLSVRGAGFDRTQVLLNGINFSDPQTGHYSLDLPIDLSGVGCIEVLQGLSAPGAIGGALNISTAERSVPGAQLSLEGGGYGYFGARGRASAGGKKWGGMLAASHTRSDGYSANTDFQTTNLYAFFTRSGRAGTWQAQAGWQDKPYGANGFYSFAYPEQFEHTRTFLGSVRWQKALRRAELSAALYHRTHFDRFELFRGESPDWYAGHNYHCTQVGGAQADIKLHTPLGTTTLDAELRREGIESNVLGYPTADPRRVPFEKGAWYDHGTERNLLRVLLSQGYTARGIAANAGVSLHRSDDYGSHWCMAGDVRAKLSPHAALYAAANQSLRLPTFTDLFYNSKTHQANPDLKPEKAVTAEMGIKTAGRAWRASANIFARRATDLIDWVYTEGQSTSKCMNYNRVDAAGAEIAAEWTPGRDNPAALVRHLGAGYSYMYSKLAAAPRTTSYITDYLKHKLNAVLEHRLWPRNVKMTWSATLYDRAGSYVDNLSGNLKDFAPFMVLDAGLTWENPRTKVFIRANNLLDKRYSDYAGLRQPGRWLSAGVGLRL